MCIDTFFLIKTAACVSTLYLIKTAACVSIPFHRISRLRSTYIGIAGHDKDHCDHQSFTMSTGRAYLAFVVSVVAVAVWLVWMDQRHGVWLVWMDGS